VRRLTGSLPPSEGRARIAGHDVVAEPVAAREGIGLVPEKGNVTDFELLEPEALRPRLREIATRLRRATG